MKFYFCLIFTLFFLHIGGGVVVGQESNKRINYTLSGYVQEEGSREHLPSVSVYIPTLKKGTTTNDYGFFSLTVPSGTYDVLISYVGYKTVSKSVILTEDKNLNFELEISEESLDAVVISGAQVIKESKKVQMSITTIKPSDIEEIPMFLGEKDVLKTLQLMPGIKGGTEGTSGLYVRGGGPDQNLILLDDAPVYNANHLFGMFSVFNGDAVKSVEAFKGGFPARFGGRLSSVIKIDLKDGNKERFAGKANIGLISSSAVLEGPIKKEKTSFIASGRRTYLDLLTLPFQKEEFGKGGYFFYDFNAKLHHVFNDKNKLFWSSYLGQDKFYGRLNTVGEKDEISLGWGNITSTLRWNHQFNNKLFANTSLIYSQYKFEVALDQKYQNDFYEFKTSSGINDYGIKSDFSWYPNTAHSLRFGLSTTLHNFVPERTVLKASDADPVDKKSELNSLESAAYIEDTWDVSDFVTVSPGIRLSHFSYEGLNYIKPEPRLSIACKVAPDVSIKASYANMNQYIHLLSSSGIGLPTDLWVSSTEKVKPQISEQVAVGLAKDFGDTGYSFTAEAYYKVMKNIIAYKEGASFLILDNLESAKNIDWQDNITAGRGLAYGTELLFRKQRGKLTGWLGYTLSYSEREFDDLNAGRKFFDKYDRRHDISLVGIYKPNKRLTLSGSWVYSTGNNFTLPNLSSLSSASQFPILSGNYNPLVTDFSTQRNNFRAESYHRLDLGINWHKQLKKNKERTWGLFIYNTYANRNPFFYFLEADDNYNGQDSSTSKVKLKRVSLLNVVPSFSYTLKF